MDRQIQEIIERIDAGEAVELGDDLKNLINSIMANRLDEGDIVQVIKTGQIGTVTKKVPYNRVFQECYSPHGYTAVQVETESGKHNYAGRSLRIIRRKG